jgi:hypothetical protein
MPQPRGQRAFGDFSRTPRVPQAQGIGNELNGIGGLIAESGRHGGSIRQRLGQCKVMKSPKKKAAGRSPPPFQSG